MAVISNNSFLRGDEMCNLCDESEDGMTFCQDCGSPTCFDDETAYVTASGDLFCVRCGRGYDEAEEQAWEDDWGWSYPVSWYDPGSDLDQLEDGDTPRTVWIGNDQCPHCGSGNTERIDTVNGDDDPAIWFVQCGQCDETFEVIAPKTTD